MREPQEFILGEFRRTLDERFRLSIPAEMLSGLGWTDSGDSDASQVECMLVKERPGCLSLWKSELWQERVDAGIELVKAKMRAGKLEGQLSQVQMLGRLLSTRHRPVQLAGRGRLLLPEGFRDFLRVEAGGEVLVVGAAICVEIWQPDAWFAYLDGRMPRFSKLFNRLSG